MILILLVTISYTGGSNSYYSKLKIQKLCFFCFVGWLVGCIGLYGPLRQYFSLYRAVSQREGEKKGNDSREKNCPNNPQGWSGGAMVLGKLPVPGRRAIWFTVGQGPTALAAGAGGGCLDIFTLIFPFYPLSPSLWETA